MGGCATKPRGSNLESLQRENPTGTDQAPNPVEVDSSIEDKTNTETNQNGEEPLVDLSDPKPVVSNSENDEEPLVDLSETKPVVSNSDGDVNEELKNANTDVVSQLCEPNPDASQGPSKDLSDGKDKAGDVGDVVSVSDTVASDEKKVEILAEAPKSNVASDEKSVDSTPVESKNVETSPISA